MEKMVPLNSSGNLLLISSLSLPQTANRPQKGSMLNSRREQESRFIHVNKLLRYTLRAGDDVKKNIRDKLSDDICSKIPRTFLNQISVQNKFENKINQSKTRALYAV